MTISSLHPSANKVAKASTCVHSSRLLSKSFQHTHTHTHTHTHFIFLSFLFLKKKSYYKGFFVTLFFLMFHVNFSRSLHTNIPINIIHSLAWMYYDYSSGPYWWTFSSCFHFLYKQYMCMYNMCAYMYVHIYVYAYSFTVLPLFLLDTFLKVGFLLLSIIRHQGKKN